MGVLVIAEAGVNHNGNVSLAKKMIDIAAQAGSDIVKFQTFNPKLVISKHAQKAEYQKQTTGKAESQLDMIKKYTLSDIEHHELVEHSKERKIQFLSTPFDIESIDFIAKLELPYWKIPSGEITNLPYLIEIGRTRKPILLSTGMSELHEINVAIEVLKKGGADDITLLHCNTQYPTPFEDVNLSALNTLRREFGFPVGYSDHTTGIEVAIAAVALGAVVIEKHFTLDRSMEGPDHRASIEPDELAAMIRAIRNVEVAIGDGVKRVTPSECGNLNIARKSIVAMRDIYAGEVFSEENITTKRPGNGISPMRWFELIGMQARRNFEEDEMIEL